MSEPLFCSVGRAPVHTTRGGACDDLGLRLVLRDMSSPRPAVAVAPLPAHPDLTLPVCGRSASRRVLRPQRSADDAHHARGPAGGRRAGRRTHRCRPRRPTSSTSVAARARPPAGRPGPGPRSPASTRPRSCTGWPAACRGVSDRAASTTSTARPRRYRRRRHRHGPVVGRHRPSLAGRRGGRVRGPTRAGARRAGCSSPSAASPRAPTGLASHGWTDAQAASFAAHLTRAGFSDIETEHCHAGRPTVVVTAVHP